jgi:hypothetical protein
MSVRALKNRSQGRLALLSWLNEFLDMDYAKVGDLSDGVGYCQVFDACGAKVPLGKLNYSPRDKSDRVANMKLLERVLRHHNIAKDLPTDALASGKFQANTEFLQFCFDYLHKTYPNANKTYNAYEKRRDAIVKQAGAMPESAYPGSGRVTLKSRIPPPTVLVPPPPAPPALPPELASLAWGVEETTLEEVVVPPNAPPPMLAVSPPAMAPPAFAGPRRASPTVSEGTEEVTEEEEEEKLYVDRIVRKLETALTASVMGQRKLEDKVESVGVERDFYHDTLQAIEQAILEECRRQPELAQSDVASDLIAILKST